MTYQIRRQLSFEDLLLQNIISKDDELSFSVFSRKLAVKMHRRVRRSPEHSNTNFDQLRAFLLLFWKLSSCLCSDFRAFASSLTS